VAKVLDYARVSAETAQQAEQFVLAQLPDKNRDVVAFLVDRAEGGDLTAIEKFEGTIARPTSRTPANVLRKLCDAPHAAVAPRESRRHDRPHGDAASRDWLVALRDDASQDAKVRDAARAAVDRMAR